MHRFFFSLRFRLISLVFLALLPALVLTIYTGLEERRMAGAQVEQMLQKMTRLISIEYDQILERSEQLLIILAQLQLIQDFDQKKCQALFINLLKKFRGFDCIGIISTDGNMICHTPSPKEPISFAGQSSFERAVQTRGFANGHYQICPITKRAYLPLAYPVLDERREVKGVISVGLDLLWLNQLASEVQLPEGSMLFVIDQNGTILAHYPDPQKWVGRSVRQAPIVKTMLTLQKEDTREALGIDGVMHLHSSTPVGRKYEAGLHVAIGIPKKVVFSKVDFIFRRNLILLGIVTALAFVAAWFFGDSLILRKVNVLLATTNRLARGDSGARTGLPLGKGEIDQLANSFDRMAERLEQYEANHRERIEEERRLREFVEIVFNSMHESISVIDVKDFRVIDANQAYLNEVGLKKEEVIGEHCYELTHRSPVPCTPPDHPCPILDLIKNGKYSVYEHIHYRKNEKRYVEVSASPIMDKGGQIVQVVHTTRDITERKLAEEALRASEEKYRTLIESSIDAILMLDTERRIISCNQGFCNLFGYSRNEVEGRSARLLYASDESYRSFGEMVYPIVREEGFFRGEREFVRKDGSKIPVETITSAIKSPDGKITGYVNISRDITERKKAEKEMASLQEQLRQSQKMEAIGQLAGGVAHDFNNLLTVIKGTCQLSLLDLHENDPIYESLKEIERSAERAAGLTRQLLAFSRKQILEVQVLDLNQVIQRLDKMLHRIIGEDIGLVTFFAEELGRVKADPGQMEQVIINLSVNARDAMPKGGKLTIETANVELDEAYAKRHIAVKPGFYVMLSISDTGVGMPPEVKERLFEPFFTTKEMGKGTGLGLSTVYGIVKQSGGNIWVYSEPGQGTTFKIYLPRVDEPLEERKEEVIQEVTKGDETILVVEDEETVRKLAVRLLKKQGYQVLEAPDGGQAFILCEKYEGSIHLILSDVVMPGMSGRELVERLQKIHPEAKILYMSGYTDNVIAHHGILEKGIEFISKPFTLESLARKVREVLDS
ncbi:MAG: PAS domain S-box protein [Deltaproteobacteria bacterium]|nr:PAS domain S-box protein [Deltaproteobacteria bacterium]